MVRDHLARLTLACCLGSLGALGVLAIGGIDQAGLLGGVAAIVTAVAVAATPGAWRGARPPEERPLLDATLEVEDVALIDEGDRGIDSLWRVDVRIEPVADGAVRRWAPADLELAPLTPMLLVARNGLLASASPLVESAPVMIERLHVLGADGLPAPSPGLLGGAARLRIVVSAPPDARRLRIRHGLEELGDVELPEEAVARTAAHLDAGAPIEAATDDAEHVSVPEATSAAAESAPRDDAGDATRRPVAPTPWDTAITMKPVRTAAPSEDGRSDRARERIESR